MAMGILQILILAAIVVITLAMSLRLNRPQARAADRAREVVREVGGGHILTEDDTADEPSFHESARDLFTRLGEKLPLFSAQQRKVIHGLLLSAGFRQSHALSVFITAKLLSGAFGAGAGLVGSHLLPETLGAIFSILVFMGGLQVGLMAPEMGLRFYVHRRRLAVHKAVPDALDLMVICTNAGYSLGASIKRIGEELTTVAPALADEMQITAHEIQMNADPILALRHLAERTGVECLRSMVATLIQAHQYGTPITQSLRTLARTERTARILLLEEKGAKLAAKLTMPMMLMILPAVMLIAGGPAFLRMMEAFR